ncbi:unnamed protein product [Adineta ricciae]|uniref:Agmatine deiminase n=1 Tax=Adineta ricciae TaxID=249248 RepID=A0A813SUF7_ADIRI|nr:unnamed protein product [Adineta ricciae]CAF1462126.1 unnamed protein product [Adineta ricciae]
MESKVKTLLVLAAPSIKSKYYSEKFADIIEFMTNFAKLANGKDDLIILADTDTLPSFQGKIDPNKLIEAQIDDIWIRDFSPAIPTRQIKFKYAPSYIKLSDSKYVENSFLRWCSKHDVHFFEKSDIILDAGNIVDNPSGTRVIITDRVLQDNPSLTKASAKEKLRQILGVDEIAIIKQLPGDTTGHADGMVMWATDDRILFASETEPLHSEIISELKASFPNVEIIETPNYFVDETWKNFTTARNVYVNSIVTDHYIYMPTFNSKHDDEMLKQFQSYTDKSVIAVPAENVCMMGGSIRCLTWQVKDSIRMKILPPRTS